MAAPIGKIGHFDPERDNWSQYCERLELYFIANGVTDTERKKAIFLTVIGPPTYNLVSSLVAPAKPVDKTLAQLMDVAKKHYCPPPSEIVQRHKFYTRCKQLTY